MSGAKLFLSGVIVAILSCYILQLATAQITDPSEVNALNTIRSTLIDPMDNLNTWGNGDPCTSNWTGILCYNSSFSDGYLHIQKLELLNMDLSGNLAPDFGRLSYLKILDVMWNNINGSIPKDIGNITSLELLLLNGNQLSGPLPDELGYLPNLNRIQIDQNQISGQLPKSFANLNKTKHFHMNNNSISGQIPPELSRLPSLVHFLLDNNNLSGHLPPEFSRLPNLLILQVDNNNFSGSSIPPSYGNMTHLLKLSLRNCSLQGVVPDLSNIPGLAYLDLSWNHLTGSIPPNKLSNNITTVDLSNNFLNGPIPSIFSGLPNLQTLSLQNNRLNGSVPSAIWNNMTFSGNKHLVLDFENNSLSDIPNTLNPPANVTILLYGNPVCAKANQLNIIQYCQSQIIVQKLSSLMNSQMSCGPCPTELDYEYNPSDPMRCFCSVPLAIGYRLKSPGFIYFRQYYDDFEEYLTSGLDLFLYQLDIESFIWEEGPRLRMNLKLFPNNSSLFNSSEVLRISNMFTGWLISDSDIFGPYEVLNVTLGSYANGILNPSQSGLSNGVVVGIVLAAVACAITLSIVATVLIMRRRSKYRRVLKKGSVSKIPKIDGVKGFTLQEMELATNNFSSAIGQGGYGTVYKGILADGTAVAIKGLGEKSTQGFKEFVTEIELLSRVHHRNLVSLVGYCEEEDKQMLVYEFIPNGNLREHLSAKSREPLNFSMRLRIALGSSRGILYLHSEADPPIFHRDIKASNILLDSKFVAKVSDFGLSRLAPVPDIEGTVPGPVSTVVKGTPGYLDPEYFLTHKLTDKSDVYSLGIVFLELLTAMQPISYGKNIVREVASAYQSGEMYSVIDKRMGFYPSDCIEKFVALALRCCHDVPDARPAMSEVVRELENIWRMSPEADVMPTESTVVDESSNASSSSMAAYKPFLSSDASGSDLQSGMVPVITAR